MNGVSDRRFRIPVLLVVSPCTVNGELYSHNKLACRAKVNISCERCSKHACDRNIVARDVM